MNYLIYAMIVWNIGATGINVFRAMMPDLISRKQRATHWALAVVFFLMSFWLLTLC